MPKVPVGARVLPGHRLRVATSASAELAAAAIDAMLDAGLARVDDRVPADLVVLAVPAGKGNGALNVAARAVELDLAGAGRELEDALYRARPDVEPVDPL